MDDGVTKEDYRGASIPERIYVFNNTITGNNHGLTGGDNLYAINNIIVNNLILGIKNTDGGSEVAYNLFYGNGTDIENSNVDLTTTVFQDPLFTPNFELQDQSLLCA